MVRKKVIRITMVFLLILLVFYLTRTSFSYPFSPLFPRLLDPRCRYYKDIFGQVFNKTSYMTTSPISPSTMESNWNRVNNINPWQFKIYKILSTSGKKTLSSGNEDLDYLRDFECYAAASNRTIFGGIVFNSSDQNSFLSLQNGLFKDKNHVYLWNGSISTDADASTFEMITNNDCPEYYSTYYKDINHIYYGASILHQADRKSFAVICPDSLFDYRITRARDNKQVYDSGQIIK